MNRDFDEAAARELKAELRQLADTILDLEARGRLLAEAAALLKQLGEGISVGPMLLGIARPAHILTSSVTVRGILNMSALAVVDAQVHAASAAASG